MAKFATCSLDKSVWLWTLDESNNWPPVTTSKLHETHTSEVTCLYYDLNKNTLFSGGKDCRLVGYDLAHERVSYGGGKDTRKEMGIKDILPVGEVNPQLLALDCLVRSTTVQNAEFSIVDTRCGYDQVLKISRGSPTGNYHKANIHPNGMLVAAGNNLNEICIWDLRYIKVRNDQPQKIADVHQKGIPSI